MARSKIQIKTIEDGIISSDISEKIDRDSDRDLKYEKRDKASAHISNMVKKVKVDAAMELMNENYTSESSTSEIDTIEGEVEVCNTQSENISQSSKDGSLKYKKSKSSNSKLQDEIFKGLGLNSQQKQWVINYCDPESDTFNDKHGAYLKSGYTAKNKNSLIANISMNMKKPKIREAMDRYRRMMIDSKKLEISSDMVDILRRRASYSLDTFYREDGTMVPYSEIPEEWRCCVDDRSIDYKGTSGQKKIEKYVLCDRHKSIQELNKLLEIQQGLSNIPKNTGGRPSSVTAAIDMGKDKEGNQGPRVVFSITPYQKSEDD